MPRISDFRGIEIAMYYNDHQPPHFHASYGDDEAVIDIRTGNVLKGSLPNWALNLVKQWASLHQQELLDNWQLARDRKPLNKIAPLP